MAPEVSEPGVADPNLPVLKARSFFKELRGLPSSPILNTTKGERSTLRTSDRAAKMSPLQRF